MEQQSEIFRDVALMAGDIIFKYDLKTCKFMQYSDKLEFSRYGSWIFDLENALVSANMIHPDDANRYKVIMRRIKEGDLGTIEGLFRMKISVSADYRWHRLLARTNFDGNEPVDVIGRITDIHEYVTSLGSRGNMFGSVEDREAGIFDKDTFLDEMIRYGRRHKEEMVACVIFNMPAYDEIISSLNPEKTGEFITNLMRRLRRCFSYGTIIGRVGLHRFGVFTGGNNIAMDIGSSVEKVIDSMKSFGQQYGVDIVMNVGICLEEYAPGIEAIVYDKAHSALSDANQKGLGSIEFFSGGDKEERVETVFNKEDIIVEYALELFRSGAFMREGKDGPLTQDEITTSVLGSIETIIANVGRKFDLDRISVSLRHGESYKQYSEWNGDRMQVVPEGCRLKVEGNVVEIEKKVTKRIPYLVNNVAAYPDDSEYGRIIGFTSVKSIAQGRFECSTGINGIISIERYDAAHVWTKEELVLLEVAKYIAEFCVRYIS